MTTNFKKWLLYPPPPPKPRTEFDNIFIGPSSIRIGTLEINRTLKDSPVQISIKKKMEEVRTTKSGGALDATISTITDLSAEFTILYSTSIYNQLKEITGFDPNSDFTKLKEVSVLFRNDENLEIFRANVTLDLDINFKRDKISTIKISVVALKDKERGYFQIGGIN